MCTDIRSQWQKRILTKEKREPLDSYVILTTRMQNPSLSLEEVANELNYDIDRVYDLSSKYFHASRLEAFSKHQMELLMPQIISNTSNNLKWSAEHDAKQNELMRKHERIREALLDDMIEDIDKGQKPSRDKTNIYKTHDDIYNNDRETQAETNLKNAKAVQIIQGKEGNADGSNTDATKFIESLQHNREQHRQ